MKTPYRSVSGIYHRDMRDFRYAAQIFSKLNRKWQSSWSRSQKVTENCDLCLGCDRPQKMGAGVSSRRISNDSGCEAVARAVFDGLNGTPTRIRRKKSALNKETVKFVLISHINYGYDPRCGVGLPIILPT